MDAYDPNNPGFTLMNFIRCRLPTIETIMTQVAPGTGSLEGDFWSGQKNIWSNRKKGIQAILERGNKWWSGINP